MSFLFGSTPSRPGRRAAHRASPRAELLESRQCPSAVNWPGLVNPTAELEANDTLDVAQDVGSVSLGQSIGIVGTIGSGTGRSNDVDWFQFSVSGLSRVQISSLADALGAEHSVAVSLYGPPLAEFDPSTPLGHVLLGRQDVDSRSPLSAVLDAGTYFVAVSGAGNRFFHPFLANSGVAGTATEYGVRLQSLSVALNAVPTAPLTLPAEPTRAGDDTPATSTNLGNLAESRHLQVEGAIGNDRFYRANSSNPLAQNRAADVDLYHIQVTGNGRFGLTVEAFAGRIGSPLDPALTLFRADSSGALRQIAANNDTLNTTVSTNGQLPLFTDALLFAGLTAGDYYLAVSSSGNDPASGPDGVFNPQVAHSGLYGFSTGAYVLDVSLTPDNQPPTVVSATPAAGAVLDVTPTHLDVRFSEPVNVAQLALSAYQASGIDTVRAVFLVDTNGMRYFPRLQSYDSATSTARFLMLDGLPNGSIELHVSGAEGLTDFAGLPIQGNQADGDFVTRFVVAGPERGSHGQPTRWLNQAANGSLDTAQNLGVLFPHELQSRINILRDATTNAGQPADAADVFRFEVLQSRPYFFTLRNTANVGNLRVEVLRENGSSAGLISLAGGTLQLGSLSAGRYLARVTG
jgi:hypothetical protein